MKLINRLRRTRTLEATSNQNFASLNRRRISFTSTKSVWAAVIIVFSVAAIAGLSHRIGGADVWGANVTLMAAEAAPAVQPAPVPQGYRPAFRDLVGVNGGLDPDIMTAMKIGAIRKAVYWDTVEPSRGHWNWTATDTAIQGGIKQNVLMVPMLAYTAHWATGGADGFHPAQNPSDWTTYVTEVVSHYTAAPFNLKYFQVWNEPTKAAGFWKGATDQQWVDVIYLPAARIIREHGARVVFGGWPNGALQEFDQELQYHNAWQSTDILDVHYFGLPVIQQLYAKWVATGKCKGIWETEVGNVNNPVFLTNLYSGVFNWAKTGGNWTFPEQYKLFWYPSAGAGCGMCLANKGPNGKLVETANGKALEKLAASLP